MLYVENTLGGDITAFDEAEGFKKRGGMRLGAGIQPDDICASSDGSVIYANGAYLPETLLSEDPTSSESERRNRFMAQYDGKDSHIVGDQNQIHNMAGDRSVLVAFDASSFEELWRVKINGHVGHLAITPDDRYVFNSLFDRFFVARVDTHSQCVDYIPLPTNGGHGVRVSPDGGSVYVGSILMSELDVIDVESSRLTKRLLFPDNVRPFDITADGEVAYVQNSRFHGFHVVHIESGKIRCSIALPPLPPGTPTIDAFPHTVDHGLVLSPDESRILALATTGNYVAIYSHPNIELLGTVRLGGEPSWVITDSSGDYAFCSNRTTDDVSVVSISELKEVERFHAGLYPQRLWFT